MAPPSNPTDDGLTAEERQRMAADAKKLAAKQEKERKALADATDIAAKASSAANDRVRAASDALERECRAAIDLACAAEEACRRLLLPKDEDDGAPPIPTPSKLPSLTLVSVVLDPLSTDYDRWRDLVLLTLERFAHSSHDLSDAAHPDVPAWRRMDSVVHAVLAVWCCNHGAAGHCARSRRHRSHGLASHRGAVP
ncbi:unnamed protein product [Urochloa humidicola]